MCFFLCCKSSSLRGLFSSLQQVEILSLVAVHRLLTIAATLIAEHGLWESGQSNCQHVVAQLWLSLIRLDSCGQQVSCFVMWDLLRRINTVVLHWQVIFT